MKEKDLSQKQNIVFVHGAWHGAWAWDPWLDYFRSRGYQTYTVELRGHGYKKGDYSQARMTNYVNDVKTLVNELDEPPILIGHSLGCSIIQYIIADSDYPGAVLLAPIPEARLIKRVLLYQAIRHPFISVKSLVTFNMRPWVTSRVSPRLFFSPYLDISLAKHYISLMQGESARLFLLDLIRKIPDKNSTTPVLVVSAELDSFFKRQHQQKTAHNLGADYAVAPNSGHDIMLDVGQQEVAEGIVKWLASTS